MRNESIKQLSTYTTSDHLIGSDSASTNPRSVYYRLRRLNNDAVSEALNVSSKKSRNKKKQKKILEKIQWRTNKPWSRQAIVERVRFHIGKGRDVGDIAVRERITVSMVNNAIEQINGTAK